MFETATDKPFLEGEQLNPMDFKKMNVAIDNLETDLKSPGILSNKVLRSFYTGSAKTMRNPITRDFYNTLVNANEFRNRHSQQMMTSYNKMISDLKLAIMDFQGDTDMSKVDAGKYQWRDLVRINHLKGKRKANQLFESLNVKEKALLRKKSEEQPFVKEMDDLFEFLGNEGSVFQDFMDRVTTGNDLVLKRKYRENPDIYKGYIGRINNAATRWSKIQQESKITLVQSIKNLSETINMKYGKTSKTAQRLIDEYKDIANRLDNSDEGYIPHYVIDIMGESLEMSDRINKTENSIQIDDILLEYVGKAKEINTNLSQRLKAKSKEPNEYFSRNPVLYASKYIEQIIQFNHNSFVDKAYTEGLKKLTNVAMKNDGKESGAAKVYLDVFEDMYSAATNKNRNIDKNDNAENLFRLLTSLQFVSKLGWSTRGAVRNGTQRLLNFVQFGALAQADAMKELGVMSNANKEYKDRMTTELNHHGLQFGDISKVTDGSVTAADLIANGIDTESGQLTYTDRQTVLQKMTVAGIKLADASSILTKFAENLNRQSTFKVAFHKRVKQLEKTKDFQFAEGETLDKMYRQAGNYAAKMVELLHFEYSPIGKAKVLQSKPGAILGQFMHYAFSFANFQAQMLKDYKNAFKAGDYAGQEAGRIVRMASLIAITDALSILFNANLSSYVQNDTFDRATEFLKFLAGDEEEKREAFYGKGLAGAIGSVPVSDLIEIHNLGAAAGYWEMLADPESTAGWLMGMKQYDKIDNKEFAKEVAGMFSIEGERLLRRTGPALFYKGSTLSNIITAEFGLYPGTTTLGFKTRSARENVMDRLKIGTKPKVGRRSYKGKYSRNSVLKSLDNFS